LVTWLLIILLVIGIISLVLVAARDELEDVLLQLGRLLASPFDAVLSLLERFALWLIPTLNRGWAALRREAEGDAHLVLDCIVCLLLAGAAALLTYTELALTSLTIGPMLGLAVPFDPHDLNRYLSWSFVVGVAVTAFAAWELRPHHDPENAPPAHASAFGLLSHRSREWLFRVLIGLLAFAVVGAIAGVLWRLQALAGVFDWAAAGIFMIAYTALVAVALAIAAIVAIRGIALILVLAGEGLLIADWLSAIPAWIALRILDGCVGVLVAVIALGHAITRVARRGDDRAAGENPRDRQPISGYVPFPAFIFRRSSTVAGPTEQLARPESQAPGTWSDAVPPSNDRSARVGAEASPPVVMEPEAEPGPASVEGSVPITPSGQDDSNESPIGTGQEPPADSNGRNPAPSDPSEIVGS
jgi:hypothetical protein